jgi:hypothetical protein
MSSYGYTYWKCPKCDETSYKFEEFSRYTSGNEDCYTDMAIVPQMRPSGHILKCSYCLHIDLPEKFIRRNPPEGESSEFGKRPKCEELDGVNDYNDIKMWLHENETDIHTEAIIWSYFYFEERKRDIQNLRSELRRKEAALKIKESAIKNNQEDQLFFAAEVCRGAKLVSDANELLSQIELNFPTWNPEFVKSVKELLLNFDFTPTRFKFVDKKLKLNTSQPLMPKWDYEEMKVVRQKIAEAHAKSKI